MKKTKKVKKKSVILKEAEETFKASHVAVIFEDVREALNFWRRVR